jgi:hypothetical protein
MAGAGKRRAKRGGKGGTGGGDEKESPQGVGANATERAATPQPSAAQPPDPQQALVPAEPTTVVVQPEEPPTVVVQPEKPPTYVKLELDEGTHRRYPVSDISIF